MLAELIGTVDVSGTVSYAGAGCIQVYTSVDTYDKYTVCTGCLYVLYTQWSVHQYHTSVHTSVHVFIVWCIQWVGVARKV